MTSGGAAVPGEPAESGGSMYDRVGGRDWFVALVDRFYDRVAVDEVLQIHDKAEAMRQAARSYAQRCSWDAVFDRVVDAYPAARTQLL